MIRPKMQVAILVYVYVYVLYFLPVTDFPYIHSGEGARRFHRHNQQRRDAKKGVSSCAFCFALAILLYFSFIFNIILRKTPKQLCRCVRLWAELLNHPREVVQYLRSAPEHFHKIHTPGDGLRARRAWSAPIVGCNPSHSTTTAARALKTNAHFRYVFLYVPKECNTDNFLANLNTNHVRARAERLQKSSHLRRRATRTNTIIFQSGMERNERGVGGVLCGNSVGGTRRVMHSVRLASSSIYMYEYI